MSFYPNGYEPKDPLSDYMKLTEGEHKIRILMPPVIGFETWDNRKPYRAKTYQEAINLPSEDGKINEFHLFIVWDYETQMIRVLNVTQKSIQRWIYNQTLDEDWADPTSYDIVIKRTGKTISDTEYTLTAKLPKPMEKAVSGALKEVTIVTDNYFEGGHPIVRNEGVSKDEAKEVLNAKDIADNIPF